MDRKGLGRGLSALLADVTSDESDGSVAGERGLPTETVPVEKLHPNDWQPRRTFSDNDLDELAASIREKGILQPLIVRPKPGGADFEIVAGERRWRAAQRARLHEVPVLIRSLSDSEVLEIALIENIQRSDLNPLDEAQAYKQLMERFGHTQEKLAESLGKSRSHIANLLRLLSLPEPVLQLLRDGQLSAGHARALVTATDPVSLARQICERGLSVRETEALVRAKAKSSQEEAPFSKAELDPDTRALEQDLSASIGLAVSIKHGANRQRGELRIRYSSLDELDGLCQRLSR